jgi:hypothetical protein
MFKTDGADFLMKVTETACWDLASILEDIWKEKEKECDPQFMILTFTPRSDFQLLYALKPPAAAV